MQKNYGEYDVIIAGGGTAGVIAGITAARYHLKTLIVEQMGCLGGSQTAAMVTPMMDLLIEGNPEISGINQEIKKVLQQQQEGRDNWFNPEALKFVLEDLFLKAKGELLYFTHAIDVIKEENVVKGIVIHNKSGIQKIMGKIVIDATGDADIAAKASVPVESGKKTTGVNQPLSVRFEVANIDLEQFGAFLRNLGQTEETEPENCYGAHTPDAIWPLSPVFEKGLKQGLITEEDAKYFQFFAIPGKPGALAFNCPEIFSKIDGTNTDHLTQAMVKGRRAISRLLKFMKVYFKGFEEAYLLMVAPMVGIRESRRIIGEYQLTGADVAGYKKFEDGIAKCNYYMDIHDMSEDEKRQLESFKNEHILAGQRYFEVPFRSCIPKGVENLLVTGRCISADFEAQSAMRIQQVCRALGEGCGHAAYIAITKNQKLRELDGKEVRNLMRQNGAMM